MAVTAKAVMELRDKTGAGMMDCKRALTDADGDADKAVELLRERGLAKAVKRSGRETSEGTVAMALDGGTAGIVELGCETDFVAKTDDFQALAAEVASLTAQHPEASGVEALLAVSVGSETLGDRIASAVGKLGENIVLKRAERCHVDGAGTAGGYIHAGGKLGVVVVLETAASGDAVAGLAKDLAMHIAAADPFPVAIDRDGVAKDLIDKEAELFRKQAEQEGKPEKVIERIVEGRIKKFYSEVCLLEQAFVKDPDQTIQQLLGAASEKLGNPVSVAAFVRYRLGETAGA